MKKNFIPFIEGLQRLACELRILNDNCPSDRQGPIAGLISSGLWAPAAGVAAVGAAAGPAVMEVVSNLIGRYTILLMFYSLT